MDFTSIPKGEIVDKLGIDVKSTLQHKILLRTQIEKMIRE